MGDAAQEVACARPTDHLEAVLASGELGLAHAWVAGSSWVAAAAIVDHPWGVGSDCLVVGKKHDPGAHANLEGEEQNRQMGHANLKGAHLADPEPRDRANRLAGLEQQVLHPETCPRSSSICGAYAHRHAHAVRGCDSGSASF